MTALKTSAVALATAVLMATGASPVLAQDMTQEQELEQQLELECETGAYGQTTTCRVEGEQRGEQRQDILGVAQNVVVLENGKVIRTHAMADTGINPVILMAGAAVTLAGASAAAYKLINRA